MLNDISLLLHFGYKHFVLFDRLYIDIATLEIVFCHCADLWVIVWNFVGPMPIILKS